MDAIHPHFTARTSLGFLLLFLLQSSGEALEMTPSRVCTCDSPVYIEENNAVGAVVTTITIEEGVSLQIISEDHTSPFRLEGNQLVAAQVLDYETNTVHTVKILCNQPSSGIQINIIVIVFVENMNDNPPVFDQNPYNVSVPEMSPVGTTIGTFHASDLDKPNELNYTLQSDSNLFKLKAPTIPAILVKTPLDYDRVKNVQLVLHVQDTSLRSAAIGVTYSASTTIMVNILDDDNRTPWFQPCAKYEVGGNMICHSAGYNGTVTLGKQEPGVLPLKPGPLYAIDGDSGINEAITYSFLSGNEEHLFEINANTGNISMLRPADVIGTISLTVLAAQKKNSYQSAITTVTIRVLVESLHLPKFQKPSYEGIITGVGSMAMDMNSEDEALVILATDDDYATTGYLNPLITYSIVGSSDFSIVNGHLFMSKALPETSLSLQVVAKDTSNSESDTAQLTVEVKSGLNTTTTTSLPSSTEDIMTTTSMVETTSNSETTETIASTTDPSMSTEGSVSTTAPSVTSESTAHPLTVIVPSGRYGSGDMAALGATLGSLLFVCVVVIGVLVFNMQRGKGDWGKIYEANLFRSSLGQGSGGHKEGIQYTNKAFDNDEDQGSMGSGGPGGGSVMAGKEPQNVVADNLLKEAIVKSLAPLHALLPDDSSEAGSDKADSEKEVKPILTKERRMEEGYKAVWFKEDIDPNAKDEVVIIQDNRGHDSEEEDQGQPSGNKEEEDDDNPLIKTPKVAFADADLDSGLEVKMGNPAGDSDGDEALDCDL